MSIYKPDYCFSKDSCRTSIWVLQCLHQSMSTLSLSNNLQLVEPKRLTLAQLKEYDGSDKKKPIYLAIRGIIFDVSKGGLYSCSKAHPSSHASTNQCQKLLGNSVSLAP